MRSEASPSCSHPYTTRLSSVKMDFRHLHAENLRPMRQFIQGSQKDMNQVQAYLKKIHVFEAPQSQGSRDIVYHIHNAEKIPIEQRRQLLRNIYNPIPRGGESTLQAVIGRGPCKFVRNAAQHRDYTCPVQGRKYRLPNGNARLPGDLQRLLKHAVQWGAHQANPGVSIKDAQGYANIAIDRDSSISQHAYDYIEGLAKTLNVGDLPTTRSVESMNKIWSTIQSHIWSGHRCLISEFRKNWGRGCNACKARTPSNRPSSRSESATCNSK